MKELFVPYPIALALKEIGFDEKCMGYYRDNGKSLVYKIFSTEITINKKRYPDSIYGIPVYAPLYDQVISYLWEKYQMKVVIDPSESREFLNEKIEATIRNIHNKKSSK